MSAIFVFGFDISEASQIRRIRLLQKAGFDVASAAMRRENMNKGFVPDWPNIELAKVENGRLGARLLSIVGSFARMIAHRKSVAASDVVWARNFDMLAIAWLSRLIAGSARRGQPLVYECLDIHGLLTGSRLANRLARAAERFLLRRADLLIVSSPGFIDNYFHPAQGYDGPWELIENKISFGANPPARPSPRIQGDTSAVPSLGWVGTLRCRPSFELLLGLASKMGVDVEISMHGIVHEHVLSDFHERVAEHPNVTYAGPYDYPHGLVDVYGACDLVWSQDLWQAGGNSDWLLPNRIYEASWCGCPSVAVADTETGRYVERRRLGFVVAEPTVECLSNCIERIWPDDVRSVSNDLLSREDTEFEQTTRDIQTALAPIMRADMAVGEIGAAAP